MNRLTLERRQVWIYLAAIATGLALGNAAPGLRGTLEAALWPVLALLLYATFVQIPLLHVRRALRDRRFILAIVLGNFVAIPLLVWALLQALPDEPALRLGVALVLLTPCTDWFITFTQLGRGDTARAIAVTPLNLLAQVLLLPVYLWWLMPAGSVQAAFDPRELLPVVAALIGLPLAAAALSERWIEARPQRAVWRARLGWWSVPLLALTLLLIAAAQVDAMRSAAPWIAATLPVFVVFLAAVLWIALGLARLLELPATSGRTLAFSLGTRNSFVVLPIALALPPGWEAAIVVIVLQSLVELFGMVACLWLVPGRLFPAPR
ncbi:arsenic resistance protein [Pseudothauera nasutitermitis]|uniref:Arsenic resistance protein n=1 Tax=Pseudothauera nasutitermitis TaxID=2565930 RepID=A0A4S4B605_9RHOO|nr:arsenic resistance protein [Pseudothauera nasutitermitis]THF66407.1 arsenic resistance protein [Pseudothauera nasutitermitis]